jgi:sugar O-acyltransferase (sialic acid O-acetyltransferase NeuD family)
MATERIVLIGGGGHCRSCIDVIEAEGRYRIAGILDPARSGSMLGYPLLGGDELLESLLADGVSHALVTVGHVGPAPGRVLLYTRCREIGYRLPVIIAPTAHVARSASLGSGTIVMHHAVVNSCATVGENCIINTQALVEHDVHIANHCHVSTAVSINGGVTVGAGSFLGSNATIVPGVSIGAEVTVGAASLVLRDLPSGGVFLGVPARRQSSA